MSLPTTAQIVIIGGGVMGASTAYHLAQRGCTDVVLLERQPFFGMGATGKCAGGIRYQFSTEINIRLSLLSLPMFDRFEAELGQPIGLRRDGYLFLLTSEEDIATFRRNVALQHSLGVPTEWLDGDEVRRRVPLLSADDVLAGTFHARDGLADPNSVVMGYVNAAKRLGVRAFTGVEVTGITTERDRITGVVTSQGAIACEGVINAAGPWSARVSEMAGIPLPVTPLRRQMLTTTALPEVPKDFPFIIDFAQSLYFHREGEGLLTGQSNPHERPGYDESVDLEWELTHMEAAIQRLPILARAGRAAHWAGLYEVTPDAHPIIDAIASLPGYYVITGFSGHGFMHGPGAGLLLSEIILDGKAHTLDISALGYSRFADAQHIHEYNVI
ncbi:MAG TPA: FAD-binding oxidoreductase [Chloroflexi bacterium]|nr:FAD-binding oxidoreductase [Chloroflexota bacterium]HHW85636.1 FAD-binding oxidoreductase [Chloroflexota bacterium]